MIDSTIQKGDHLQLKDTDKEFVVVGFCNIEKSFYIEKGFLCSTYDDGYILRDLDDDPEDMGEATDPFIVCPVEMINQKFEVI